MGWKGMGIHWDWGTMGGGYDRTRAQLDEKAWGWGYTWAQWGGDTIGWHSGMKRDGNGDTLGLGHNGTGVQWDGDTIGWGHSGMERDGDTDAMGLGYSWKQAQWMDPILMMYREKLGFLKDILEDKSIC